MKLETFLNFNIFVIRPGLEFQQTNEMKTKEKKKKN